MIVFFFQAVLKCHSKLGMVVHICDPWTQETELGWIFESEDSLNYRDALSHTPKMAPWGLLGKHEGCSTCLQNPDKYKMGGQPGIPALKGGSRASPEEIG